MAGMHVAVIQVKVFGGAIRTAEQQRAGEARAFHHLLICQHLDMVLTVTFMLFISI